ACPLCSIRALATTLASRASLFSSGCGLSVAVILVVVPSAVRKCGCAFPTVVWWLPSVTILSRGPIVGRDHALKGLPQRRDVTGVRLVFERPEDALGDRDGIGIAGPAGDRVGVRHLDQVAVGVLEHVLGATLDPGRGRCRRVECGVVVLERFL